MSLAVTASAIVFIWLAPRAVLAADPGPSAPAPTATPAATDASNPVVSALPANGFVERLPPSAFPAPKVRGIYGGSLWLTFHGLQWPYYPKTGIGISGSAWVDTGYETVHRGNPTEKSIKYQLQQGRLVLRVTPTYSDGKFFVQGQAELVANKDQSLHQPDVADTDDLWIRTGMWNLWDAQVGRFEGWEVYHLGMGLDLNTLERQGALDEALSAPDIYGVTYGFYRAPGIGQAAAHIYPTDYLRFELGTQFGNEAGSNAIGARPVGVLDFGWLKLKAGAEYKVLTDQKEGSLGKKILRGAGGGIQFIFDPRIEFGVSAAAAITDHTGSDGVLDEKGSVTTVSVGGFLNVRIVGDLIFGGGANYTYLENLHRDPALRRVENFNHVQTFLALQYIVMKQLFIKAVAAHATAEFNPTFGDPIYTNEMLSGRLRVMYLF
jgi:hypothetical protein